MSDARILIVEDDAGQARLLQTWLVRYGYTVVAVANTGSAAVRQAAALQPDLVLMDVELAGEEDGVAVAQQIQTQVDVPVIYVTARSGDEWLAQYPALEAWGYLGKPVRDRELHITLEMALYKYRMDKQLKELARFPNENPHPILRAARDGMLLYANAASAPLLHAWQIAVNQPLPEMWRELVLATLAANQSSEIEVECAGQTFALTLVPIANQQYVNLYGRDITARVQMERALRESQERFKALVNSMDDIVFTLDTAQRHTGVYGRWLEKAGLMPAMFLGKTPGEILGEGAGQVHDQANRRALAGATVVYEWSIDNQRHTQTVLAPLYDAAGVVVGVVGVGRDITARVQMERELRASEERFKALIEFAPNAIVIINRQGQITLINARAEDLVGYSRAELIGQPVELLLPARLQAGHVAYRAAFVAAPVIRPMGAGRDLYAVHKNGREFPVEVGLSTIGTGDDLQVISYLIDISDRKRAEDALRQSENSLNLAQQVSHTGSWELDHRTGELVWSDEIYRIFGLLPREFGATYEAFLNVVHPADREYVNAAYQAALGRKAVYDIEHRIIRPDGTVRFVHEKCDITFDAAGRPVRSLGVVQDITERWLDQEALRSQKEYLDALNQTTLGLVSRLELTDLLRNIIKRAAALVGTAHGHVYLLEPDKSAMVLQVGIGIQANDVGRRVTRGVGLTGAVWQAGQAIVVDDYTIWPGRIRDFADCDPCMRAAVGVPLKSGAEVVGMIGLAYVETERKFGPSELEILGRFAELAAIALDNARLYAAVQQELAERARVEAALRESEEKLRRLFDEALDGIALADAETGVLLDCNAALAAMVERAKTELVGQPQNILHPPASTGEFSPTFEQHRTGLSGQVLEAQLVSKTGVLRDVEIKANTWELGGRCVIQGIFRDVTERRRAEEQLRLQSTALEAAANAIVITDRQGRILWVNAAFTRLTGYSAAEVLGQNPRLLKSGQHDAAFYAALWRTILAGQVWHGEIINRHREGRLYTEEVTIAPVCDPAGRVTHFVAIKQDITARKQAEELQARLLKDIESANRELREFAYVVSHDLKAPLRAISSLAEWLAADYADKLEADGQEMIQLLLGRTKRMHDLIEGVLQYSRVGRIHEDKVSVEVNALVAEVLDSLAPPPHVHVTVQPDLPRVVCEKTRLFQVFQNLLSNAIRYLDKPQGMIHIGCTAQGRMWQFSVSDNGPGIEEKYYEKIFQLFQTLRPRDEVESTGVGLAVVKKAVELHGGQVWVESTVGQGSTFFFTLPQ